MTSVEKQSLDTFKSQEGETNAAFTELCSMTQSSSFRNEILDAIESQIRYIASQIATSSVSGGLRDDSGEPSDATSQGYPASSEDDKSLLYETSASDFTTPNCPDKRKDERRFSDVCGTSVASPTFCLKLGTVDRSTSRLENDRKSEVTLPSYTEMCGDEEDLFAANEPSEDTESNAKEENVSESGDSEETPARLPGCFGDYETGIPAAAKYYRYIGKQRPNYEEFEITARWTLPARVPPAESTAVDCVMSVERWLSGSKGKVEFDMPDYRFPYESDIRQSCSDVVPPLSSSAIDMSSKASSNRKRLLDDFESETGVESSKSETDICRAQPRRLLKRRKLSGH